MGTSDSEKPIRDKCDLCESHCSSNKLKNVLIYEKSMSGKEVVSTTFVLCPTHYKKATAQKRPKNDSDSEYVWDLYHSGVRSKKSHVAGYHQEQVETQESEEKVKNDENLSGTQSNSVSGM